MNIIAWLKNLLLWTDGLWGLLTVIFWSITYILIVIAGFLSQREEKVSMPYVAGVLNVAWEVAAMIYTKGNPGFIAWFFIDIFIVLWGVLFLPSAKKRILYGVSILVMIVLYLLSFNLFSPAFLFTVYLIDIIMEVEFIFKRARLSKKFKISIAVAKLLGDVFAGLTFGHLSVYIIIAALISFICNAVYLIMCIKERLVQTTE